MNDYEVDDERRRPSPYWHSVIYGDQSASQAWEIPAWVERSPDRDMVNLGQPLKQLEGEPDPLALWCLFAQIYKSKLRAKMAAKYFGPAKRGPISGRKLIA